MQLSDKLNDDLCQILGMLPPGKTVLERMTATNLLQLPPPSANGDAKP